MRVFKTKEFARFCRKQKLDDLRLLDVVAEIEAGLVDAALGGEVYKQRVAGSGQGKSGGFRTILFLRLGVRTLFVYGFAKKDRDNVNPREVAVLKEAATALLDADDDIVTSFLDSGAWLEIETDAKDIS